MNTISPINPTGSGPAVERRPETALSRDAAQPPKDARPFDSFMKAADDNSTAESSDTAHLPDAENSETPDEKLGQDDLQFLSTGAQTPGDERLEDARAFEISGKPNADAGAGAPNSGKDQVTLTNDAEQPPDPLNSVVQKDDRSRAEPELGKNTKAPEFAGPGSQFLSAVTSDADFRARQSLAAIRAGAILDSENSGAAVSEATVKVAGKLENTKVAAADLATSHDSEEKIRTDVTASASPTPAEKADSSLATGFKVMAQPVQMSAMSFGVSNLERLLDTDRAHSELWPSSHSDDTISGFDVTQVGLSKENSYMPTTRVETVRFIGGQLSAAISAKPGTDKIEITLNPQELGRVSMGLSTKDDVLVLSITGDRAETLDLMRRHISELSAEFRELGYNSISFDFHNRDQGSSRKEKTPNPESSSDDREIFDTRPIRVAGSGLDLRI